MTTTLVRPGQHRCTLPPAASYTQGAILMCDDCGALWRLSVTGGLLELWSPRPAWLRVTRLRAWWLHRWGGLGAKECPACKGTGRAS